MTNSKQEYNDFVRANLPGSIRYDSVRNRYVTANNKYFVTYKEAKWYVDYLVKRGSNLAYAEGGYTPSTILDYSGQKSYVGGNLTSSFDDVVTATRTGLATQLDASGNLVWNAHNLIPRSQDFSFWSTASTSISVTTGKTDPDGGLTAVELEATGNFATILIDTALTPSFDVTTVYYVRRVSGSGAINIFAADGTPTDISSSLTSEWQPLSVTGVYTGGGNFRARIQIATSGDIVQLAFVHAYRSDLGGMAPVPLTRRVAGSTTYVPTTSAAVYLPREEAYAYVSGSLVGPYYQKESDARTNLFDYSNLFDGSGVWLAPFTSTISKDVVGPDGEANSGTTLTSTGTFPQIYADVSVATSTKYTISIYAKAGTGNWLRIFLENFTTPAGLPSVWFDVENGIKGTVDAGIDGASIEDAGNGWYRCSITFTTDSVDTSGRISFRLVTGDGVATGISGQTLLFFGAQLEQGSTPSSYIPTSGSTVTRSADSTTISAGNMPYPTPQVIGPELVDDFTLFAQTVSKTGTSTGSLSFVDGLLTISRLTEDTAAGWLDAALVSTSVYEVSYRVVSGTAVFAAGSQFTGQVPGSYSRIVTGGPGVRFWSQSTNSTIVVDNISVREINPLALSFQLEGLMTYADDGSNVELFSWDAGTGQIDVFIGTGGATTGLAQAFQRGDGGSSISPLGDSGSQYIPGLNVPFSVASTHTSVKGQVANDGVSGVELSGSGILPDLSSTTFELAPTFNGFIKTFRVWADDIGDTGIAEAST